MQTPGEGETLAQVSSDNTLGCKQELQMLEIVLWRMYNVLNVMSGDTIGTIVPGSQGKRRHSTLVLMLGTPKGTPKVVKMVAEAETEAEAKVEAVVEQLELVDAEEDRFLMSEL